MLHLTLIALLTQTAAGPQLSTGSVQGIVVRVGTAEGLSRATVELRRDDERATAPPPGMPPQLMSTLTPPPLFATTTEGDGRFLFPNVGPGRYRIVTTRPGYVPRPATVTVAGGRTEQVQVTLSPTAAISGRMFGANGEPVGNAEVEALKPTYQNGRRQLTAVTSVRSNDLGEYRLFWLPPGRYFVRATHAEAQVGPIVGMARFGGMGGGSTLGNAGPNGNFFAMRSTSDRTLVETVLTETAVDDEYVPIYFPGTLDDQAASAVDLSGGADAGGIDIRVTPIRRRLVRGAVVNGATGEIAQYAGLREAQVDAPFGPGTPGGGGLSNNGESPIEPDGTFHVTLLPGRHTLIGTAGTGTGYLTIDVRDSDIDNVRIVAMPAFDVAGRILSDGPVDTAALANIRITLQRDLPVPLAPNSYSQPRADGTFVVEATPGDYHLNVAPLLIVALGPSLPLNIPKLLQNVYVKAVRVGNVDVLNNGIHLERPTVDPLEIVIGTNPGGLEGSVSTASQTPAAGTTVVILPAVRGRFDLIKTTATDPSGRFRLDRLPPGDYTVFAWEEVSDGAWQDPDFMRTYEDRGAPIRIAEGRTERVALMAIPVP